MPYYQELFLNDGYDLSSVATVGSSFVVRNSALVTSYRSSPHPNAIASRELLDINVDPYAYFLSSTDRKNYAARLAERGLPAIGGPDRGHAFESIKHTIDARLHNLKVISKAWENGLIGYSGSELNSVHNGNHRVIPSYGTDTLGNFARQAYSRVAPTSVVFDAANFLGELHEGLPRLILSSLKGQSGFFRKLGNEYLNVEFGWKPFLRDIINAATALYKATNQLAQQGQRVHRRYSVPISMTFQDSASIGSLTADLRSGNAFPDGLIPSGFPSPLSVMGYPMPLTPGVITAASYSKRYAYKRKTVERWFEGEFSSFYPLNFDPTNYFSRLNVLVNTKVTPETLWNLTPWSWLVDWNLRLGDSIRSNILRANDLLIMHYGYAMEETVYTTGSSFGSPNNTATTTYPASAGMVARTVRKRRIRANPYGFGVGGASALTGSQLAILGALGLTKL